MLQYFEFKLENKLKTIQTLKYPNLKNRRHICFREDVVVYKFFDDKIYFFQISISSCVNSKSVFKLKRRVINILLFEYSSKQIQIRFTNSWRYFQHQCRSIVVAITNSFLHHYEQHGMMFP
jgi:hypothetical protein